MLLVVFLGFECIFRYLLGVVVDWYLVGFMMDLIWNGYLEIFWVVILNVFLYEFNCSKLYRFMWYNCGVVLVNYYIDLLVNVWIWLRVENDMIC